MRRDQSRVGENAGSSDLGRAAQALGARQGGVGLGAADEQDSCCFLERSARLRRASSDGARDDHRAYTDARMKPHLSMPRFFSSYLGIQ
jgi:hypothetical protein